MLGAVLKLRPKGAFALPLQERGGYRRGGSRGTGGWLGWFARMSNGRISREIV